MIYYPGILFIPFLIIMLLIIFLISRFFLQRTMIIPARLFYAALQKENEGRFEEAELGYRSALEEVKRKRFPDRKFRDTIIEKIKILNTVIAYNRGSRIYV